MDEERLEEMDGLDTDVERQIGSPNGRIVVLETCRRLHSPP